MDNGSRSSLDEGSPEGPVLLALAKELAGEVAARYHVDSEVALQTILAVWAHDPQLRELAAEGGNLPRVKRTRAYKQAATKAKAKVYNELRKYKADKEQLVSKLQSLRALASVGADCSHPDAIAARDEIVRLHFSTAERLPDVTAFFDALFELEPAPPSLLDVGCGVFPLLYPFTGHGSATTSYLGLDRDALVVEIVNAWGSLLGDDRLRARCWSLSEGFGSITGPEADGRFSLALGLKLIPVIARQERDLLPVFRDLPARRFLVTGARESMVKRQRIERRELAVLRAFARQQSFAILGQLSVETEVGLQLGRAEPSEGPRSSGGV